MSVSATMCRQLEQASWIRRMFEVGLKLKAERSPEHVFDFTLGNPEVAPPGELIETLRRVARRNSPGSHGYMPNAGFPAVREVIAARLAQRTGLPFTAGHVIMTVGASGAINAFLKAVLDPGDEVIVPLPCFSEYPFYIDNHGGRMVTVDTREDFELDVEGIVRAVTPRTKAVILNSPHNPTGVVFPEESLRELDGALPEYVTVISDEPYRALVYDGQKTPPTATLVRRSVIADSWSKCLAIAGERIGYLAFSPRLEGVPELMAACSFTNRILGYINAPAIWQWVVAEMPPEAVVDIAGYQRKRDLFCDALAAMGYQIRRPQGAFYLFPRTPIPDDIAFVRRLQAEGILAVPGVGFRWPGHLRLSLTVPLETIQRSLAGFERAVRNVPVAQ